MIGHTEDSGTLCLFYSLDLFSLQWDEKGKGIVIISCSFCFSHFNLMFLRIYPLHIGSK